MSDRHNAVFLSYASQDAEAAQRICEALRAAGVEVWFDQSELRGGDAWDQKIRRQIKECALFVPVISANTQARREGYFRFEWRLAVERMQHMDDELPFLVPLVIDDTREPGAFVPDRFRTVQWTRLPAGETNATFCERMKLLLRDQLVVAERLSVPPGAGSRSATLLRSAERKRWLAATALVTVAVALLAWWRPWSPRTALAPAAISEAQELTLQGRALIDDDPMAVRENFRLAEELCQRAVGLAPADGDAWATCARVSLGMLLRSYDTSVERRELARNQVSRALRLAPDAVETGLALGTQLMFLGEVADAERRLREVARRAPTDRRVLRQLAVVCQSAGKEAEALELLQRCQALFGGDVEALDEEAARFWNARNYVEAEALTDKSLALAPSRRG